MLRVCAHASTVHCRCVRITSRGEVAVAEGPAAGHGHNSVRPWPLPQQQRANTRPPPPWHPLAASLPQCVLQRRGSSLGYWGTLMIDSVITGFNGSLSTVSTFITEVRGGHKCKAALPARLSTWEDAMPSLAVSTCDARPLQPCLRCPSAHLTTPSTYPSQAGGQVCRRHPRQLPRLYLHSAVPGRRICAGNRHLWLVGVG